MIESKRVDEGYIRIIRIEHQDEAELIDEIINMIDNTITQQTAEDILTRLREKEVITEREKTLMLSAIDMRTLAFKLSLRDEVRADVLKVVEMKCRLFAQ